MQSMLDNIIFYKHDFFFLTFLTFAVLFPQMFWEMWFKFVSFLRKD